jgi:REP element-mobilizing transposase RayT
MVQETWIEQSHFYGGIALDAFIIMPNHIHGVVAMVHPLAGKAGQAQGPAPTISLPDVVRRLKSLTTTKYVQGVKIGGWPAFDGRLWQRNYFERVIRNSQELSNIQRYIGENPVRWQFDRENPNATAAENDDPWT